MKTSLSEILRERGYVYQFSAETLEEITDGPRRTLYLGIDPTADSLHVGQLMGTLILRRFVEAGHTLILLVGDGTGMVGDPGGKSAERNLLEYAVVQKNAESIRAQLSALFGGIEVTVVRNSQWLHALNYMEFLRDIGKHFTVNEMIKRDTVRPRIETLDQSISYTEFSYMLLQAYDYLELHRTVGCDLQVGGSDQWGNIISGVDLIRRKTGDKTYAFSWPLLVDKKSGKKFGKSEGNAVWLDANKTSPFQFYQFWLTTDDVMVEELLYKMTMISAHEIAAIIAAHATNPAERIAQRELARAVTRLVHGEIETARVEKVSDILFGNAPLENIDTESIAIIEHAAPIYTVQAGEAYTDILVAASLASSKREARQFLADGAVTVNGKKVQETATIAPDTFVQHIALLKRGKRNAVVLRCS